MGWNRDIHYAVYEGEELVALFTYTAADEHLYMGNSLKKGFRYRPLDEKEYETMIAFELAPVMSPAEYSEL